GRLREVVEDVAEGDEVRACVRKLDAHCLLARDRREDADLRRRERVREVVLEPCDLRDLRPGCELQLVARHPRAGDGSDNRCGGASRWNERRAARCTARPEPRMIAPAEAPVTSRAPASSASTPTISTPVPPMARPRPPPTAVPR